MAEAPTTLLHFRLKTQTFCCVFASHLCQNARKCWWKQRLSETGLLIKTLRFSVGQWRKKLTDVSSLAYAEFQVQFISSFLAVLVWISEDAAKTLVQAEIFCHVFAYTKTETCENVLVWSGPDFRPSCWGVLPREYIFERPEESQGITGALLVNLSIVVFSLFLFFFGSLVKNRVNSLQVSCSMH